LAPLHPEGGVQHDPLDPGGEGSQFGGQTGFDAGVQQGFQPGPQDRIGEGQTGQNGTVKAAVLGQDLRSEHGHQFGQPFGCRLHHFPGDLVGVDHHPARGGQPDGSIGFSNGDAAGQPHDGVGGLGQA